MRGLDTNNHSVFSMYYHLVWSKSFCLLTTGGVSIEVIKKYIKKQGK